MKQICCIDCEHCYDHTTDDGGTIFIVTYYCDAGSVLKKIDNPEKVIDCPDFVQFIEDI